MKLKMWHRALALGLSLALVFVQCPVSAAEETQVVLLKTDGLTSPLGIDNSAPAFSWRMESDRIGAAQSAYQVKVTDPEGNVVWDSGEVDSNQSVDVIYEGEQLLPRTAYTWKVTVTDELGEKITSTPASFETALMDETLSSWNGAAWVGAETLRLDAATTNYFHIQTKVQIPEDSQKAALVFGADDFRYDNPYFNLDQLTGENYVKVELDLSQVGELGGASFNIYRAGMFAGDDAASPLLCINSTDNPATNLDSLLTAANAHEEHQLDLEVCAGALTLYLDGEMVVTGAEANPYTGEESLTGTIELCPLGSGGNYNTYPNLCSIGFAAEAGQSAVFTDYQLLNPGYGTGVLFGTDIGATTAIFDGLEGISREGASIQVEGGEKGILSVANPSFGSAPMLRKTFTAQKEIERARLYISAQGIYEPYVNGERLGDDWFNPGNNEYREEISYQTYDLTDKLVVGENAIGAQLGRGWWDGYVTYTLSNYNYYGDQEALLAMVCIDYTDGTSDTVVTDSSWQVFTDGPVVADSFFQGETYDARKEAAVKDFSAPEYDASAWQEAALIETRPVFSGYKLKTRKDSPAGVVKEVEVQTALGESREGSGSYVYDMGENVIGVPQIVVPKDYASEGDVITLRYGEILYPDNEEYVSKNLNGLIMVENYRAAFSTDFYIMGEDDLVIEPHFTFHGYRYVEITGVNQELPAENVKTLVLSSVPITSTYESSNELTNRLFKNVQNSQTSNFLSLPTDCPQRNERMGWMGDAQVFAKAASYNADVYNFYQEWLGSVRADQAENGNLPVYAPSYEPVVDGQVLLDTMFWDGISWKCAVAVIPYALYTQTGRTEIISENMDCILSYLDYLKANPFTYTDPEGIEQTEEALTSKTGFLADWLARVETDASLINNAVYVYTLGITAQMAEVIGEVETAQDLLARYEAAKQAWNRIYLQSETGLTQSPDGTVNDTQASYATALAMDVVSEEMSELAAENFEKTVREPSVTVDTDGVPIVPYTLTTGFSGTPFLVPVLTRYGYLDTAYALFESQEYASWLYPVTQGATSVWERWNSYTEEGGFNGNNSMNSFNHFSLGAISEWMMAYQLGITTKAGQAGYQDFVLAPAVGGSFTYAGGSFESEWGTIESRWTAKDGALTSYSATVPANTTATLYLPVDAVEGFEGAEGVSFLGMAECYGRSVGEFTLQAGTYTFTVDENGLSVA